MVCSLVAGLVLVVGYSAFTFCAPTLQPYLQEEVQSVAYSGTSLLHTQDILKKTSLNYYKDKFEGTMQGEEKDDYDGHQIEQRASYR